MAFQISNAAIDTFKQEWGLKDGQYVRIYAKYQGGAKDGFAIGINVSADPIDPATVQTIGGYHFFVEKTDEWIVRDVTLQIDSNQEDGIYLKI